ncbi:MAG: sulfotransferase [Phycisphaeraceae bacterium]|nr:sulfotransferase [Phycisphaeraceae bacterium]
MTTRDYKLFFVCGHARSGTTWLQRVLDLHPGINCRGEFHFEVVRKAFDTFTTRPWHLTSKEPLKSVAEQGFCDMVRKVMLALADRKPEAEWIGDRTPRPLRALIPGTPHVLMVRDGRDVMVSFTIHQMRTQGIEIQAPRWQKRLGEDIEALRADPDHFKNHPERLFADEQWVRFTAERWVRRCTHDLQAIEEFRTGVHAGTAILVRYEDLWRTPDAERARIYRFLELDPADALPLEAGRETTPGLNRDDHGAKDRKGEMGDWKTYAQGEVGQRFRQIVKESAGDMLVRLGYEKTHDW